MREMQIRVAVCGVKNSGKTTLIEKLLPALTARGLKVAVVKHDGHEFECDVPGTDSYRMTAAGAYGTAVFSSGQIFLRKAVRDRTAEEMAALFPEADLLIFEGLKDSAYPKIELVRAGNSAEPVSNPAGRFLIVSDLEREFGEPTAGFDETDRIVEAILEQGRGADSAGHGSAGGRGAQIEMDELQPEQGRGFAGGRGVRMETDEPRSERASGTEFSAIVLAGGRSTRMGADKARLELGGETLADRQCRKLRGLGVADVILSGYGEGMVPDERPGCGPLGGLSICLRRARCEQVLVVPVDVPFLPEEVLRTLMEEHAAGDSPVTLAVHGERTEYLIGVYERSLAGQIDALLDRGEHAVRALLEITGYRGVPFCGREEAFLNCNTQEAYQRCVCEEKRQAQSCSESACACPSYLLK